MTLKKYIPLCFILFGISLCRSLQEQNLKDIIRDDSLVGYIYLEPINSKPKLSTKTELFINESILKKILTSIQYKKRVPGYIGKNIIHESSIDKIIQLILQYQLEYPLQYYQYFFVIKLEDELDPFLRFYRTSFFLYQNGLKLEIIFNDINHNYIYDYRYSYKEWAYPEKIDICNYSNDVEVLLLDKIYSYRKIDQSCFQNWFTEKMPNNENHAWIFFDLPILKDIEDVKSLITNPMNIKDKLELLKELKEKGLINEEEFNFKKKQILDAL